MFTLDSCRTEELVVPVSRTVSALAVHPATDEVFMATTAGELATLDIQSNDAAEQDVWL